MYATIDALEAALPTTDAAGLGNTDAVTQVVCPSIVGRDGEWAELVQCLDDSAVGRGGLVAVVGEVGIGKTRLARDLADHARSAGMWVLVGRAVETGAATPFRALFEALSGYFRQAGTDAHPELERLRSTLALLVPEWRVPGEEPYRASPMELAEALVRLLTGIAGETGCVLILEDLHWGDPDTAAVVEYLGDNLTSTRVLCVVTLRPDVGTPAFRVVTELMGRRSARLIELQRLTTDETMAMARLCLGGRELPADIDVYVRDFSDGLPFLVEELMASAVDTGSIVLDAQGWRIGSGGLPSIPPRFVELVRRRMAALPEDAARVLSAAAVLGPRIDPGLLRVVTGLSGDTTITALRLGIDHQLVTTDPADDRQFGFRHALTTRRGAQPVAANRADRRVPTRVRRDRAPPSRLPGRAVRAGGLARRGDRRPSAAPPNSGCWPASERTRPARCRAAHRYSTAHGR